MQCAVGFSLTKALLWGLGSALRWLFALPERVCLCTCIFFILGIDTGLVHSVSSRNLSVTRPRHPDNRFVAFFVRHRS